MAIYLSKVFSTKLHLKRHERVKINVERDRKRIHLVESTGTNFPITNTGRPW